MKKLLTIILILTISIFTLGGCNKAQGSKVTMEAKILNVNNNLLVEVTKSEYAFGEYVLLLNDATKYYNKNGNAISKQNLAVGDIIKVEYSGQVMLSIPPQVVAHKITVI